MKDKYYGNSIILTESICEVKNKYYSHIFLDEIFKTHNDNNANSLFKELKSHTKISYKLLIGLMMNLTIKKPNILFIGLIVHAEIFY